MAHFHGTIQGQRGQASRLGNRHSGLTVKANGWTVGATVDITHENGKDVVRVYRTNGSAPDAKSELVAQWEE